MIYIIYGSDTLRSRHAWQTLIASLEKKHPGMSIFALSRERATPANLEELLAGQTLFDKKYIVTCDHLLEEPELAAYVTTQAKEFGEAAHLFVFLEDKLGKEAKPLLKQAFETKVYDRTAKEDKGFNIFAVADALGARDRKSLWLKYQQALRSQEFDEEDIFWKLVWQIKTMLLVKSAGPGEKLELHPFVLSKMKSAADKYSREELVGLSAGLVELYHQSRRGKLDLDLALEQWVLSV